MQAKEQDVDLEQWLSTYVLITIERILGRFDITLEPKTLLVLVHNPLSIYHRILQVPLRNLRNGIRVQQTHDYYVYVQKLYVDFLLSGESNTAPEAQGSTVLETLADERRQLVSIGESFHDLELAQDALIAKSQMYLLKVTKAWQQQLKNSLQTVATVLKNAGYDCKTQAIQNAINRTLCSYNAQDYPQQAADFLMKALSLNPDNALQAKLEENLTPLGQIAPDLEDNVRVYSIEADSITDSVQAFRTQMHDAILRALELMTLVSGYRINPAQDVLNKELLDFDKTI